jgi:hypothetical protein
MAIPASIDNAAVERVFMLSLPSCVDDPTMMPVKGRGSLSKIAHTLVERDSVAASELVKEKAPPKRGQ